MDIAIGQNQQTAHCFFGASIEATSALRKAAHSSEKIKTLVSDGGRPDLAITELPQVTAITLLIVGSLYTLVITINKMALKKTEIHKRINHSSRCHTSFEEQGKLQEVADLFIDTKII